MAWAVKIRASCAQSRHCLLKNGRYASCLIAIGCLLLFGLDVHTSAAPLADTDTYYQKTCIETACHPMKTKPATLLHTPFLERRCLTCHLDHSSTTTGLLQTPLDAVCQKCHTEVESNAETETLTHPPGDYTCTECHAPHQSRVRNLLRDEEKLVLCARCHRAFLEEAKRQPYSHRYFEPESNCGSCHYAHQGSTENYLRENVAESCLTCHDLPIQVSGRHLENVAQRLRESPVIHKVMQGKSCPACHTPHGAEQPSLLKPGYPAGSYQLYRSERYQLCWECHNAKLAEDPQGEGSTQFRDGEVNLHQLHVVQLRRGRTCHLCHEAHASEQPHLLRQRVRFGNWNAPLRYDSLADGGRCETPCHREKEYRRQPSMFHE